MNEWFNTGTQSVGFSNLLPNKIKSTVASFTSGWQRCSSTNISDLWPLSCHKIKWSTHVINILFIPATSQDLGHEAVLTCSCVHFLKSRPNFQLWRNLLASPCSCWLIWLFLLRRFSRNVPVGVQLQDFPRSCPSLRSEQTLFLFNYVTTWERLKD